MLLQEKWTPYDRISSLAVRLDIALDPPRFSVERVGFASGHYFGKKLGMREAVEIARQCRSQNDVIALLLARGNIPVAPLPARMTPIQRRADERAARAIEPSRNCEPYSWPQRKESGSQVMPIRVMPPSPIDDWVGHKTAPEKHSGCTQDASPG